MQPNIDSKKLFYFATVVELGSMKKAAKELSISQPALTMSMNRLETSLGVKLLTRSPVGVVPTEFGELLCRHARLIKDEMVLAESHMRKAERAGPRVLAVGVLPSLASTIVPHAVRLWQKKRPRALLRVRDEIQVTLLLELQRGTLDFIVGQTEYYDFLDGLKQRVLFRDHLCVLARVNHPLFRKQEIAWSDLAKFPWVLPMIGRRQRTLLERLFAEFDVPMPKQIVECGSVDFTRTLVADSDCLAMLPEHAVITGSYEGKIRALPISHPALSRNIVVVFRERSPPDGIGRELLGHIAAVGQRFSDES